MMIYILLLLLQILRVFGVPVEDNGLLYENDEEVSFRAVYQEFSFTTELPTIAPTKQSIVPTKQSNIDIIKKEIDDGNVRICYLLPESNDLVKKSKSPKTNAKFNKPGKRSKNNMGN